MAPHLVALLRLGLSTFAHQLHVLDVPDAVCKARLRLRNAEGAHPVTDAEFDLSRYFVPPAFTGVARAGFAPPIASAR